MKKIIAFIAAGVVVSCIVLYVLHSKESTAQPDASGVMPPPSVSVLLLDTKHIEPVQVFPARVTAMRQAQIRPQVDGVIVKRLFEEGAIVEEGQQLYQIDDARYQAAYNAAEAALQSAQANIKTLQAKERRYADLVKVKAVSGQEYDDARAALDQAQAAIAVAQADVDTARVNLEYTKVYAPITGRVGKSYVTEGALVTTGQAQHMATITQTDAVYVDLQPSAGQAANVRTRLGKGEKIKVVVQAEDGVKVTGDLSFSEVIVDETTGTVSMRAVVLNEDGLLLPGQFVKASIATAAADAVLIPQRATQRNPLGEVMVWAVTPDNRVETRIVTVGDAYRDQWIVSDGVKAGDRIIVEGYQKITDGAVVTPTPWQSQSDDSQKQE